MTGLAELQDWMQAAIVGAQARDARAHVREGNRLTAEARVGIYAASYRLRLLECLQAEYPLLAGLAGPTAFELFALGNIAAHPSHSYTLFDFGAGFADYLDANRPSGPTSAPGAIPAALARIERAKAEVARAQGVEDTVAPNAPYVTTLLGLAASAGWRLPDSVRLLALPFDFGPTLAAAEARDPPALPVPRPSLLAVARAEYRVACHPLEPLHYDWLSGLADGAPADPRLAAWLPFARAQGIVVQA
ncbi:putative DNA-binding domain-containing protein [Sphingomonas sp. MMS12-HWE2-04]|uniref:HvfC/BufC family peptide modification chaperone n=1 Tax=Sphingomonas sp. MMS12-HWE2-04 TaxID=3234199 RepID=UPI0038515610